MNRYVNGKMYTDTKVRHNTSPQKDRKEVPLSVVIYEVPTCS